MQNLRDKQHHGEQSSDGNMTKPLAETFWLGKRGIGRSAHLLYLKFDLSRLQAADLAHAGKGAPHVWNGDGAAYDQRYVQRVNHFFALPAFLAAADQVIGDAVVAAQHGGSHEPEQFFLLGAKRTGFVGLVIESEEALDAEVAAAEDFLVQVSAKLLKIFQAIGHDSSGGNISGHQPCRYYGPTLAIVLGGVLGHATLCTQLRARNLGRGALCRATRRSFRYGQ